MAAFEDADPLVQSGDGRVLLRDRGFEAREPVGVGLGKTWLRREEGKEERCDRRDDRPRDRACGERARGDPRRVPRDGRRLSEPRALRRASGADVSGSFATSPSITVSLGRRSRFGGAPPGSAATSWLSSSTIAALTPPSLMRLYIREGRRDGK